MDDCLQPFRSLHDRPRSWRWPGLSRTLRQVVLAALVMVSIATPTLAGTPDQKQLESRLAQQVLHASGKRHGRRQTVTKSFTNSGAIAIPKVGSPRDLGPANPYPSALQVSGLRDAKITDVDLTLRGLSHTFPRDVDVLLVAPDGRNAVAMAGVASSVDATNLTITLDDEAAMLLPDGIDELTSGRFRPRSIGEDIFPAPAPTPSGNIALSTFDGAIPTAHGVSSSSTTATTTRAN